MNQSLSVSTAINARPIDACPIDPYQSDACHALPEQFAPSIIAFEPISPPESAAPRMIVLQPNGSLDRSNSTNFQHVLAASLRQATDSVVVDLLWVDSTDSEGIQVLLSAIQQAAQLGKFLTFQSMDCRIRVALEGQWNQQQEGSETWSHGFSSGLNRFLEERVEP